MTRSEEKEYRDAQSWCLKNDILFYAVPVNKTYPTTVHVGGRKKRVILPYVRIAVKIDGSEKLGSMEYKQNSPELLDKFTELTLFYFKRSNYARTS